jgi:hypothetical protein
VDVEKVLVFDIAVFEKKTNESIIKVTLSNFKSSIYVHIREYKMDEDTGCLYPTTKGYAFVAEELDAIIEALQQANKVYTEYSRQNSSQFELKLEK